MLEGDGDPENISMLAGKSPPQVWQDALLDDLKEAETSSEELQMSTKEADSLRDLTDDDSDSGQLPSSQEDCQTQTLNPKSRNP